MSRSAAALISEKNAAVLLLTTMSAVLLAENENEVHRTRRCLAAGCC